MKTALLFALGLTAFFLTPAVTAPPLSAQERPAPVAATPPSPPVPAASPAPTPTPAPAPENWTTTDGKTYQNVAVIKTEPDAVTITDHDGGARIPLTNLSPNLQKRFNYDPAKAKAAADARAKADAKNAVVLQEEMDQAQVQRRLAIVATDPRGPFPTPPTRIHVVYTAPEQTPETTTETSGSDATTVDDTSIATTSGADTEHNITDTSHDPLAPNTTSNHHSMDDLVDVNSRLKDDHPSPNRHTASSLLLASSYLMPDPLDPSHHSTDELLQAASVMAPPPTDTGNRHSTDSLINGDPLAHP